MGQSCGAATSGRGLTALQVAAALRVAAAAHLKKTEAAASFSQAMRGTREVAEDLKAVSLKGCSGVQQFTVLSSDSKGKQVEVNVTEYAPDVFYSIRHLEGVEDSLFADEWLLPEDRLSMEVGEGRSCAHFLRSKSMIFMCKTIAEEEVHVLLHILRAYSQHIATYPSSFLMRYYMLLKVSVGEERGYILCFNNVFGAASVLHERWDIKGRFPKRGKTFYSERLIRPANEPGSHLTESPSNCEGYMSPGTDRLQHGRGREDTLAVNGAEDARRLPTLHDKDLTRVFWLPSSKRKELIDRLLNDYDFLMKSGLMDYSLLIGVTYQENRASQPGSWDMIEKKTISAPFGVASTLKSAEMQSASLAKAGNPLENKAKPFMKPPELANIVYSFHNQEVYYIGIIDTLTAYTLKKRTANFFKSFLWKQKSLSTIPPGRYARRITSFTQIMFPDIGKESSGA
ncbi:hypothetical protein JKF63_00031 [Porcisia hertigi]|uniref:PIPK domain-containing protein n=1 Tax=Porcisia hertigi TaxID=2761500 RepID=A0A836HCD5_9TRYP|nr:hypothetical protein JKF63_00031 [Porcisia hertigi]